MTTPAGSGVTNKGTTYANGSQITSTNLNDIVDDAVFNTNAVDGTTIGLNSSTPKALFVKDAGIDTAQIKDDAVDKTKIDFIADDLATTDTHILIADGTDFHNKAVSGDITITNAGVASISASTDLPDGVDAVTQSAGNNTTKVATTAFVTTAITNSVSSFAPSIVFTSDARNSESQRYYKNLTEIDDPNSLISINSTSEIEFASTGTYMIEAGIGLDDNDVTNPGDTYNINLVKGNSSTTVISFQGVTFGEWTLSKSDTNNKLVTYQVPYTVSNTTNDRLAIYAQPLSGADAAQWEGFATIKITKLS